MGILTRMFRSRLTEEQKEERSRKEKEWAEKCYAKGEEFAERISLEKPVNRINRFANKYPRTFFAIILGAVVGCITLNFVMTTSSDQVTETAEQMKEFSTLQLHQDPRGTIINEMVQMAENLKDLDKKIEAYQGKDTLTRQDSLNLKSLLIQADALNALLTGRREQLNTDSANINK